MSEKIVIRVSGSPIEIKELEDSVVALQNDSIKTHRQAKDRGIAVVEILITAAVSAAASEVVKSVYSLLKKFIKNKFNKAVVEKQKQGYEIQIEGESFSIPADIDEAELKRILDSKLT